ncbi:ABC transporter ATP-binding protein [Amedibacillus sp. YH-ame6]
MKKIVEFKNVCKTYGEKESMVYALRNVNFSIDEGEFVVILGPSGAGKSTILNLLGGMDEATSGNIQIEEMAIENMKEKELADYRAEKVGFVFQFYNLIPTLTVYENVALMKELKKDIMDPKDALTRVGLQAHLHKFPSQLSGGEQQRVSIARAISKYPALLLCDEPTGALDSTTGLTVLTQLKDMCKKYGHTTILVTHNAALEKAADKVIYVKNGEVENIVTHEHPCEINEVNW